MAIMGGPMSVNDDLPWIPPLLELIREGVRKDVPALGHCLGGQLMSKAFGGTVSANPVKEIGWGEVRIAENEVARSWFGELRAFLSFHWHGETFSVPPGATRIASSSHCANQAFGLGRHLGMQMHIEMTRDLIHAWCRGGAAEIAAAAASPGVQSADTIEADLDERVASLHRIADRVYERWLEGLARA